MTEQPPPVSNKRTSDLPSSSPSDSSSDTTHNHFVADLSNLVSKSSSTRRTEETTSIHGLRDNIGTLNERINVFLNERKGNKIVKSRVPVEETYEYQAPRSLRNLFGLLWYFGVSSKLQGKRISLKEESRSLPRKEDEGIHELQEIIDDYCTAYKQSAEHIRMLCRDEISPEIQRVSTTKKAYGLEFRKAHRDAQRAVKLRERLLSEYEEKRRQYSLLDPSDDSQADLEAELDLINLNIVKATNDSIMYTALAKSKKLHADFLRFVELGLFFVHEMSRTRVTSLEEYVRQLEHTRGISQLSHETIQHLVALDKKIEEATPYLQQGRATLTNLLGIGLSNYSTKNQYALEDAQNLVAGIRACKDHADGLFEESREQMKELKKSIEDTYAPGNSSQQNCAQ